MYCLNLILSNLNNCEVHVPAFSVCAPPPSVNLAGIQQFALGILSPSGHTSLVPSVNQKHFHYTRVTKLLELFSFYHHRPTIGTYGNWSITTAWTILVQNFPSIAYRISPDYLNHDNSRQFPEKYPVPRNGKFLPLVLPRKVILPHFIIQFMLHYYFSSGRLREVKKERKFQTFRGRLREVLAYKRFQI